MAGPQSISEEERLYFKGLRILHKAVAPELRQLFRRLWEQDKGKPWQDDQTSGESFFHEYKPKSVNRQYDDTIKTGNVEAWDMTVLCRAFINYTLMNSTDSDKVSILRDLRNKYAHNISLRLHQDDYEKDIGQIREVFQNLNMNEGTLAQTENIEPNDTERQELLNKMQSLRQEQIECIEEVLNKLSAVGKDILSTTESLGQEQRESKEELLNKLTLSDREHFDELKTIRQEQGELKELINKLILSDQSSSTQCGTGQEATGGEGKPDQEDSSIPGWFQRSVPETRRHQKLNPKTLMQLIPFIGGNWDFVAVQLGMTAAQIEKFKRVNQESPDLQMMKAFEKWLQAKGSEATLEAFVRALWNCNIVCTLDWDGIEDTIINGKNTE